MNSFVNTLKFYAYEHIILYLINVWMTKFGDVIYLCFPITKFAVAQHEESSSPRLQLATELG